MCLHLGNVKLVLWCMFKSKLNSYFKLRIQILYKTSRSIVNLTDTFVD